MESYTEKILITGALGQIGTELTNRLVKIHGAENVIASGLDRWDKNLTSAGFYERMDVSNTQLVRQIVKDYEITTVYHLASLLSERKCRSRCSFESNNCLRNFENGGRKMVRILPR